MYSCTPHYISTSSRLLAKLHLGSLNGKKSAKALRTALGRLVTGSDAYDAAYDAAMTRIEGQVADQTELSKQTLAILSDTRSKFSKVGLQIVLGIEIGEPNLDPGNYPDMEDVITACVGRITVDDESNMVRLVH